MKIAPYRADRVKHMQSKTQFVFSRIHFLALNKDGEMHSIVWAFILSTIFFSPYLFTANPQFNFFGDVAILYFPQFVEGYHMAQSGALSGIDFLTGVGSTAYFLRPNIPIYYPPYQIVYSLFPIETIEGLARMFVLVVYAHSILASYYCIRIGRKYFRMDIGTSLLLSVLYFGAIANYAFVEPPFYYIAALTPLLLYFALQSVEITGWWRTVLHSFPYVMAFLSGYLPLDVNAVLIVLIFSVAYCWKIENSEHHKLGLLLVRLLTPVALAGLVVLSLYVAMFFYHLQVTGVVNEVWSAAHQFSLESKDIFALLSRSFTASNPGTGAPYVILGLAPVFVLAFAYSQRKGIAITQTEAKIIPLSLLIFSFYLLLAFGYGTGLPDLFYFMVPVVGRMHMYGRYLLVASFFFYLAVAISFRHLVQIRGELPLGYSLAVLFITAFAAVGYSQIGSHIEWIDLKLLAIEIFMVSLMLISLSAQQSNYAFAGAIGVAFLIHASNFNYPINTFSLSAPSPYRNDVAFSPERRESLNNYFKQNSNKYLIKYVDVSPGIEKPNGLILNYPWMVSNKLHVSNYMGYEPHMAVDRDYMAIFPYPYYGRANFPWMLRTGVDFIIYNPASASYATELKDWINHGVPEFDMGYGYKAAKLRDASGELDYVPAKKSGDFDNGIVRVANASGTAIVTGFKTDLVSHVSFQVDSSLPVSVSYQLFPNKMMALYVDGERISTVLKDGLLEFTLPSGIHRVEYNYRNLLHQLFTIIYRIYLVLLIGIIVWQIWIAFRAFRVKQQNQTRG
jgi:hypothetical protein